MADNIAFTPGSGGTLGADDIGSVHYVRNKLIHGADGVNDGDVCDANPLPVDDAGGSLTVDDGGSTISVDDGSGSLTVDGTVAATQSGTWTVQPGNTANTTAWKVDGSAVTQPVSASSLPLPSGASTAAKQPALGTAGTASADVITVQGVASMTPLQVADNGGSITVDGTVAVSGTVAVTDNSGSLTVDNGGTFAVQVDGTALTRLTDIETNTDSGAVVGNGAAATAQRVTLANDSTGIVALTTSTASIGKLASNSGVTIGAVEIAAAQTLATLTSITNVVHVDDNSSSLTVDGTVTATIAAGATTIAKAEDVASADADVGVPAMAVRKATPANTSGTDGDYEFLQMSAGRLWTSAVIDTALPAGTNAIGKLAANSGVDIGDVDVTSVPAPLSTTGGGTEATALRVTIATDSTGVVSVDDNGGALTVDNAGTFAVQATCTNAGTFAVQSADRNGVIIRPTITISSSPDYAANDVIDTTKTLSSVMSASGRQAVLKTVTIKDAAGQGPALSLLFFRAAPSGGTYTDNSALVWGTNDLGNLVGCVRVAAGDWYTLVSKSIVSIGGIDQLMGSASSDLSMLIIADGAYNAAATTDLSMELCFEQR